MVVGGSKTSSLELSMMRAAMEMAEERSARSMASDPAIGRIMSAVEEFLRKKKLVCYGGMAINAMLPENEKFYDRKMEVPDYDCFTPNAIRDSKELADQLHKLGFANVSAQPGLHAGTYKVYVEFIPVADFTEMNAKLFKSISKHAVIEDGIRYAPADYLRMSMHLELSRPDGQVSRWEKVMQRLMLLNEHKPIVAKDCHALGAKGAIPSSIKDTIVATLAQRDAVFFGGFAAGMYAKFMPVRDRKVAKHVTGVDALCISGADAAAAVKTALQGMLVDGVTVTSYEKIDDVVPVHWIVRAGGVPVCGISNL